MEVLDTVYLAIMEIWIFNLIHIVYNALSFLTLSHKSQAFPQTPDFYFFEENTHTLNPFMPIGFSHPYQLDESISNLRVVGE